MPLPLSAALREGSAAEHRDAESAPFITALLAGELAARAHTDLLLRLRPVYATLEHALHEHRDHPVVSAVHDPGLARLSAIDADLEHWAPGESREVRSPAAEAYVQRIERDAEDPAALLAHHYTRYLGDLSGGRIIGTLLRRIYDLPAGVGATFYEFASIPHPRRYKDAYRERLDRLDLPAPRITALVDDVRAAFALNRALFDELGADLPRYRLGAA